MAEARSHHGVPFPPDPATLKGPVPRLDTLWSIERILIDANRRGEDPLNLEEIKRRMGSRGIRHATVRTCVDELQRQGKVVFVPRVGVLWTQAGPGWRKYVHERTWKRLA
jgi:hypothetical protein